MEQMDSCNWTAVVLGDWAPVRVGHPPWLELLVTDVVNRLHHLQKRHKRDHSIDPILPHLVLLPHLPVCKDPIFCVELACGLLFGPT